MYRWVDENGQVHYSDNNPGNAQQYAPPHINIATPGPEISADEPLEIRIYTTQWCGICKKAKQYMQSKGITYVEHDVEKDSAARREFRALGGRGVPLITIGQEKMMGFTPQRFEGLLAAAQKVR